MVTADKLKYIRLDKGMTQSEFAKLIGVSRCTVAFWETGRAVPNRLTLSKISPILGYDVSELESDRKDFIPKHSGSDEYTIHATMNVTLVIKANDRETAIKKANDDILDNLSEYISFRAKKR